MIKKAYFNKPVFIFNTPMESVDIERHPIVKQMETKGPLLYIFTERNDKKECIVVPFTNVTSMKVNDELSDSGTLKKTKSK